MTDTTGAVERFRCKATRTLEGYRGTMDQAVGGNWVRYSDYTALAAKLAEARAETAAVIEAIIELLVAVGIAGDADADPLATALRGVTPASTTAALDEIKRQAREDLAQRVALHIEAVQALGRGWPATTSGKVAAILALLDQAPEER